MSGSEDDGTRDRDTIERVIGEYETDTVIHLAAQTIVGIANRNPISTFETNIQGTWNLLEACRRSPGVRSIVIASLLAAATILEANGNYTSSGLEPYQRRLQARFGSGTFSRALSAILPAGVGTVLGRHLLAVPAFVRHVVVDRWFLHRHDAALGTNS